MNRNMGQRASESKVSLCNATIPTCALVASAVDRNAINFTLENKNTKKIRPATHKAKIRAVENLAVPFAMFLYLPKNHFVVI